MSSSYTLTVKFAPKGTSHFNRDDNRWEISGYGHVWLEARKPGESLDGQPSFSGGWSPGNNWLSTKDNFSSNDWKEYQGKNISSITVEISKAQFEQLEKYPVLAKAGKIPGFRPFYDAGDNSCIDFSGKGLGYIGLADKDFDGSGLFWARPDKQVNAFLEQIAKHRPQGADLTVIHRGHTYTFGENERGVEKFWKTVDPYWYLGENKQEQPYQTVSLTPYAQAAMNNGRECFTKFCDYYNIDYPKDKLDNIAAAIAAYGRAEDMRDVSKIDVDGDSVLIGHYQPDLVTAEFSLQKALNTPVEESMRQIQSAENKLLQEERERQLAHEMERSRGMGIGIG